MSAISSQADDRYWLVDPSHQQPPANPSSSNHSLSFHKNHVILNESH